MDKLELVHASRPSELINKVIKRLKSLFKTTVRTQSRPQSANCGQSLFHRVMEKVCERSVRARAQSIACTPDETADSLGTHRKLLLILNIYKGNCWPNLWRERAKRAGCRERRSSCTRGHYWFTANRAELKINPWPAVAQGWLLLKN